MTSAEVKTFPEGAAYYRVLHYDTSKQSSGLVKDYYASGKLQFVGTLLSDNPAVLDSTCTWYFENGDLQSQITYLAGELHGERSIFYEDGQLMRREYVINNHNEGMDVFYYPNGNLKEECEYKDGFIKDTCRVFHLHGALKDLTIREVMDSTMFVYFKRFRDDGSLYHDYHSTNGVIDGELKRFHRMEA